MLPDQSQYTVERRRVSIFCGASGSGKTTLVSQMVESWARGETLIPAVTWDATSIAYIGADRTSADVEELKTRLAIPEHKFEIYGMIDDTTINLKVAKANPEGTLRHIITTKFKNKFDMLIIDPLTPFIDGNTNDNRTVAFAMMELNRLAIEFDITILAICHIAKQRTDGRVKRIQDRINGSVAFQGYSSSQMVLVQGLEDDLPYDTLAVISRKKAPETVYLKRNDVGALELCSGPLGDEETVDARVKAILSTIKPDEIVEIADIHKKGKEVGLLPEAVYRSMKKFPDLIERVDRGKYSRPKKKEDQCQ